MRWSIRARSKAVKARLPERAGLIKLHVITDLRKTTVQVAPKTMLPEARRQAAVVKGKAIVFERVTRESYVAAICQSQTNHR